MKKNERFEMIRRIKLDLSGVKINESKEEMIEPNPCWEGYEAIGLKEDGSPNCVPIKEEQSKVKEGFPIPSPESGEDESQYMSRCISEISGEYEEDQAVAICIGKWQGE
jgi:hypothetical protein